MNDAINIDFKNMFARLYDVFVCMTYLIFDSSQIQFYLSCITIIWIKERNISKRSSIGPPIKVHKFKRPPYLSVFLNIPVKSVAPP